jgi:lysozyme
MTERAVGCDISWWDQTVDFNRMKAAGASFCFIKASQRVQDKKFAVNWTNSKGILLRGAYHYLDLGVSELVQADIFVNALGGDWGELPLVLDLEQDPKAFGVSDRLLQGKVWNWLTRVKAQTGRTPMIYSGYYYWTEHMTDNVAWSQFPFWLAWYAYEPMIKVPKPWNEWTFWQYSEKGDAQKYGSSKGNVDLNYFNGTKSDLLAKYGPTAPVICPTCGQVIRRGDQ